MSDTSAAHPRTSLDPEDWAELRAQVHRMLDDILDYIEGIRQRPVWQAMPGEVRERFRSGLPTMPAPIAQVHDDFMRNVLPYGTGNVHPGFMGWVHGGGNPAGVLAEMLAAGLNANLGGRDHAPIEVERQVVGWMRDLFGFPETASGLFVTGTSTANLISVLVARTAALGAGVRRKGVRGFSKRLTAYTSAAAHGCIAQAMDLSGLGIEALRIIPTDDHHRIDLDALSEAIAKDRAEGATPFLVVGTAGTVDIGAIDDLAGLADLAKAEKLWFHVDGAFGALAILAPELAPRLAGIERADSLAFDFHKWGQVPYDAGFVLVRDGRMHRSAFASPAAYLRREMRAIAKSCELAQYLRRRIETTPELELLAPIQLNIVCFGYRSPDANRLNAEIAIELQESGIAAPSTTTINGRVAIRAAIVNHRTETEDLDALIAATVAIGNARRESAAA